MTDDEFISSNGINKNGMLMPVAIIVTVQALLLVYIISQDRISSDEFTTLGGIFAFTFIPFIIYQKFTGRLSILRILGFGVIFDILFHKPIKITFAITLLITIVSLIYVYFYNMKGVTIDLYRSGIRQNSAGETREVYWGADVDVYFDFIVTNVFHLFSYDGYHIRIVHVPSGTEIAVTNFYEGIKNMSDQIISCSTSPHVHNAMEKVSRGEEATFGALSVAANYLKCVNGATESRLPFEEIQHYTLYEGWFLVKKKEALIAPIRVRVKRIPNFFAFLNVLDSTYPGLRSAT